MRMELIEAFVAVSNEGHFGRAASLLGRSTSQVSKQIRALEHAYGVRLLDRTSRRVALTGAGEQLLESAQHVLDAARVCDEMAIRLAEGRAGRLKVAYAIACFDFLEEVIGDCAIHAPGIEFDPEQARADKVLDRILADEVDLGFHWAPPTEPGLESVLFERLVLSHVVMPKEHAAATLPAIEVGDLDGETFLISRDSDDLVPQMREACEALTNHRTMRLESISSRDGFADVVRMGRGLTITNAKAAPLYKARGVATVPISDPAMWRYIDEYVSWRADNDSPALRVVIGRMRALLAPGVRMVTPEQ